MHRERRDDVASVSAQIDAPRQPYLVAHQATRMCEVEMASAAAGPAFHRHRYSAMRALEALQADVATVPEIDIDHDQAGDRTGDDADAGIRPCAKPATSLGLTCTPVLKLLPPDERSLIARPDRDDRPASSHVFADRLIHRSHRVSSPTTPGTRSPSDRHDDRTLSRIAFVEQSWHVAANRGALVAIS